MELLLISVCLLLFFLYYKLLRADSRTKELLNRFPGPKSLPIIGNSLDMNVQPSEMVPLYEKLAKDFPNRCRIWLGEKPYLIIYNTEDMEVILSSSTHIEKSYEYHFFDDWLGKGLLTRVAYIFEPWDVNIRTCRDERIQNHLPHAKNCFVQFTGDKWRVRRKMLTPAFNFRLLVEFMDVFNKQSEILVERLAEKVDKGSFDAFQFISLCTLDALCDSVMGQSVHAQFNSDSSYVTATDRMEYFFLKRQYNILYWPDFIFNHSPLGREQKKCVEIIHGFSEKVIEERKKYYNTELSNRKDEDDPYFGKKQCLTFLDILLQARENDDTLTDTEIRNEVDTFMAAGNDSAATGLSWTVFLLGLNLEIQKKAHEELDQIFGNDKKRHITMDDLKEMKYLECIIKESHRMFPPVPLVLRELTEDAVIDGKTVPAGTTIIIQIYSLHHNPEVYPEPEVFNPDRFLANNNRQSNGYSYLPFSAGPRNCIGQKYSMMLEKVIMAYILRNYSFESVHRMDEIVLTGQMTIRSEQGMQIHLKRR